MKVLLLIFIFCFNVFGQTTEKCDLTLKDAPILRGLKLGLSVNEVSKILGIEIKLKPKKTNVYLTKEEIAKYTESPKDASSLYPYIEIASTTESQDVGEKEFEYRTFDLSPEHLKDLEKISLRFYKDKLFDVDIDYLVEGYKWNNLTEFIENISGKLNLKVELWSKTTSDIGFLFCKDFGLVASISNYSQKSGASLSLTDSLVSSELSKISKAAFLEKQKQLEKEKEDKKKIFKPK